MVDTRAAKNHRTESPESDHRRYLFPNAGGKKSDVSTQSDLTGSPKTPTPTIPGVSFSSAANKSMPTHSLKVSNFTNPRGVSTSFSAAASFPIPKSVHLHDWWLSKAEGGKLAVGGFASRERQGVRVFCSAAIAKRRHTTALETIDGIKVTISGLINRSRSYQNGFPLEVCDHFLLGFPYEWEEHVAKYYDEESSARGVRTSNPTVVELKTSSGSYSNDFQSVSLDDLPVTRGRDLLMSVTGDSESGVIRRTLLNCILGESSGRTSKRAVDSVLEDPPAEHKTPRVKRKNRKDNDNAAIIESNVLSPRAGVATRSMTRSNPGSRR